LIWKWYNICAHHGRLWNRVLTAQPKYPQTNEAALLRPMVENKVPANRIFAAMCIIQYFMRYINPSSDWHERLKELMNEFPDSQHISPEMMGAIDQWDSWLLWE
jgi:abortive infection bacteriophage resistance protein